MNAKVGPIVEKHDTTSVNKKSERGLYLHLTPAQKYQVVKEQLKLGLLKLFDIMPRTILLYRLKKPRFEGYRILICLV